MRSLLSLLLATLAALAGCETSRPSPDPAQAPAAQAPAAQTTPAAEKKVYGEGVSQDVELVPLATLLQAPARYADKTIRTEGRVTAVCKSKGCWLEIGDDQSMAHIKLGNHRFFVPRDAAGQHAVVQARVMPQVDKGHCEQEAEAQTGKIAKIELDATGVELTQVR
jgi:glucose/arabinose dehydrogenase